MYREIYCALERISPDNDDDEEDEEEEPAMRPPLAIAVV